MARRQQEKSQQTQDELLASAMALFGDKGFLETSIAEITGHAGYAKGSFYRHWDSKDSLLLDILEKKLAEYRAARDKTLATAGSLTEILTIIWDFLEHITSDRSWAMVMMEFTIHAARNGDLRQQLGHSQYRLSERLFARLISGHVPEGFPSEKLGALNTALFEGFMMHKALGADILELSDMRNAALTLAKSCLEDIRQHEDTVT